MRQVRCWPTIVILLAVLLSACPRPERPGPAEPPPAATPEQPANQTAAAPPAPAADAAAVTVQPAGQPGNPFAGEYQAWDTWALELVQGQSATRGNPPLVFFPDTDDERLYAPDPPADQLKLVLRVDRQGYLVPATRVTEEIEQAIRDQRTELYGSESYWITAQGAIDPALKQQLELAQDRLVAAFYPPVPQWLAQQPPLFARLLPNGDVVTRGLLGHYAEKELFRDPCCIKKGQINGRYNAQAEMLRAILDPWWFLYYDKDTQALPPGAMQVTVDGYVKFVDPATQALLAVYDYDGTVLPLEEPVPRDPHPFIPLRGDMLTRLFNATNDKLQAGPGV